MATPPALTAAPDPQRALVPDLARGVMLLLIACANSAFYLWGHPGSTTSPHPADGSQLDRIVRAVMAIAVDGRVYPMFALLFGYGMVQFARSRASRGIQPTQITRMLRRRHLGMLLIGFLHALLLFAGDVLGAYAVLGLIAVPTLFKARDKVLKIACWVCVAYAGLLSLAVWVGMLWLEAQEGEATAEGDADSAGFGAIMNGERNYLLAAAYRLGLWLIGTSAVLLMGIMLAAVILGWLLARHRVLEEPARWRGRLKALAFGGIAVGWLSGVPTALEHLGTPILSPSQVLGYAGLNYLGGLGAGIGYAALFGLIVSRRPAPGRVTRAVAAVGRRSLTCYLFQSLLFAPLLSAWGLGLGARLNTSAVILLAIGIWLASVVLATLLERAGRRGPAEAWLRRMTYLPPERLVLPPGR